MPLLGWVPGMLYNSASCVSTRASTDVWLSCFTAQREWQHHKAEVDAMNQVRLMEAEAYHQRQVRAKQGKGRGTGVRDASCCNAIMHACVRACMLACKPLQR